MNPTRKNPMSTRNLKPSMLAVLLVAGGIASAQADSDLARVAPLPKYQQECGACHLAYPPGLLPGASWQRLMGTLNQHYGTDASLDAASVREIKDWLQTHAGSYKRVSEIAPKDRITQSAWFLRKHRADEVAPAVWKRASVGSAANCTACHRQAEQGSFSEREIRIPG